MTTDWGFNGLGLITYKRTYARPLGGTDGSTEEFPQTIERIIRACDKQLHCGFTGQENDRIREIFGSLKGSVAGRFLWQLGTRTVKNLGLMSLQNCATVAVDAPIRPFTWAFDALMLGAGVGYNIQKEYVYELPRVRKAKIVRRDTSDADFIVPDTREGWVRLLHHVLDAHFHGGGGFSYSTICIRSAGAPISGFGGTASGPETLCWGIGEISRLLNGRAGKKISPTTAMDIMNIIGSIVVAGNVRRSAQIAIGDHDDLAFLAAKRWDIGNVPNWRAMSNNSVACDDINTLPREFWEGYAGNGEPYGLINLGLSRRVGRLGDDRYPDPGVIGYNPCAEQSLGNYETCCLAEIFLPRVDSAEELREVATYLYRINKHSLALRCHHRETQEIVHRNMRMGIGVTGYLQATPEQRAWLPGTYEYLREFDRKYSSSHGWPESVKLTTVKPSGTLSLLAGVTPGVHPAYSQYYIRRVRIAASSPLVTQLRTAGYHLEPVKGFDGGQDHGTLVAEFPCEVPEGTVLAKDLSAVDQMRHVRDLQNNWSDNAVSCTVYYRRDELPEIRKYLEENYNDSIKSISFLLHQDHGFEQAPYEEITREQHEEMLSNITPLHQIDISEEEMDLAECEGGACPVK